MLEYSFLLLTYFSVRLKILNVLWIGVLQTYPEYILNMLLKIQILDLASLKIIWVGFKPDFCTSSDVLAVSGQYTNCRSWQTQRALEFSCGTKGEPCQAPTAGYCVDFQITDFTWQCWISEQPRMYHEGIDKTSCPLMNVYYSDACKALTVIHFCC